MQHPDKLPKVGVLGGGQLGRMMIQSSMNLNVYIKSLDPDPNAPCASLANEFHNGSLTDYDTVLAFGQDVDVVTVEIENVNVDALAELEKQGKKVFPQPHILKIIQDKRLQKEFYRENGIPTSEYFLIDRKEDLPKHKDFLPAVMKIGKGGYDGRGVEIIRSEADFEKGFEAPSLLEDLVNIEKEISIIIARNEKGATTVFPPVELVYTPQNMVDYLLGPANISNEILEKANTIATDLINKMGMVGLLAVEMFVTPEGDVLVNEVAPRTHNSGHQTIEANLTSQFEQHLRAILNLPLGSTKMRSASAMVNLLGEEGHTGEAVYEGLHEVLSKEGVFIHLYGKLMTKPHRKMGHVTIVDEDMDKLKEKIEIVKKTLKVKAL
ncbi:5-(carboxyamino)imidazole ribonucleotide synthase [Sediminitomix flava]|uniref:N5-carboxyaminoimidazole ribonucleotide synthase n=1 Tax=Sediminitomix flava TaxID=379075 RepID=A0A315YY90_SEDFL|nr:5-(carboxyamino)imidazole ribonucleotide synthase [Sediminitomix flava]PWJ33676.1 5-(carboxyamino)imidazole ribonucleotide synthase [Sediminitomix flava]